MRAFRGKTRQAPDAQRLVELMRELLPGYRPQPTPAEIAAVRRAERELAADPNWEG